MEILQRVADARMVFRKLRDDGASLGLVPTMGALHAGHTSLIERARADNDHVAVSIFVNPTQYDDPSDLESYPRTFAEDLEKAESAGADIILAPDYAALYPDDYRFRVGETIFSRELEGAHRPGHFDGVLTVVLKLLNIVRPDRAYFGEKDWQQLQLIRGMVDAFFMDVDIVNCPTVREADGLAMSSRNTLLSPADRRRAPLLHEAIAAGGSEEEVAERLAEEGFDVDYVERRDNRVLVAARLGKVRLIDNVQA